MLTWLFIVAAILLYAAVVLGKVPVWVSGSVKVVLGAAAIVLVAYAVIAFAPLLFFGIVLAVFYVGVATREIARRLWHGLAGAIVRAGNDQKAPRQG